MKDSKQSSSSQLQSLALTDSREVNKVAQLVLNKIPSFGRYVPLFTNDGRLYVLENGNAIAKFTTLKRNSGVHIDGIDVRKHLVLLYDDSKVARGIEFRYLKNGLNKSETCIYVLADGDHETKESIRTQIEDFGIDFKSCFDRGLLSIARIPNPSEDRDGFRMGCRKVLARLLKRALPPVRMVIHVRPKFEGEEIEGHADFESAIQSNFARFPGSMLCNHYVGDNTVSEHAAWTKRMLQTHDAVIMAVSDGSPFGRIAN